jgi:hypothetical protein
VREWSDQGFDDWRVYDGSFPWFTLEELNLLEAEAFFRAGEPVPRRVTAR